MTLVSKKINTQQINITINAVRSDVISANTPINGGKISNPTREIQVANMIPLDEFKFGS